MKRIILLITIHLIFISAFGQDKKDLTVSFSTGIFNSPYYDNSRSGRFYAVDFDYQLSKRHILSANFNAGNHDYFDRWSNSSMIRSDGTNGEASYRTSSALYKYKFLDGKNVAASLGAGVGIMTHTKQYWMRLSNTSEGPVDATWTDLVFPVRLDLDLKLPKRLRFGVIGGFFIHPDFPILGYHAGLRLGYILK